MGDPKKPLNAVFTRVGPKDCEIILRIFVFITHNLNPLGICFTSKGKQFKFFSFAFSRMILVLYFK